MKEMTFQECSRIVLEQEFPDPKPHELIKQIKELEHKLKTASFKQGFAIRHRIRILKNQYTIITQYDPSRP